MDIYLSTLVELLIRILYVELDDVSECCHFRLVECTKVGFAASASLTTYDVIHKIIHLRSTFDQPLFWRRNIDWMDYARTSGLK